MIESIDIHILKIYKKKFTLLRNMLNETSQLKKVFLLSCDIESDYSNLFFKEKMEYKLLDFIQVVPIIKALKQMKKKIYILSAKIKYTILKNYTVTKLFQEVFTFEDIIGE